MNKQSAFFTVYDWMVDYGLSGNDLNLYALIYSFSKHNTFWMVSRTYLAKRIGCSNMSAYNSLLLLLGNDLLEKRQIMKGNIMMVEYRTKEKSNDEPIKSLAAIKKLYSIKNLDRSIKELNRLPIKTFYTNNNTNNNKIISSSYNNACDNLLKEVEEMKRNQMWLEPICMTHHLKLSQLDSYFDLFIQECRCNAVNGHTSISEAQKHFHSWLRIYLDVQKKKQNHGNDWKNNRLDNVNTAQQNYLKELSEFIGEAAK